MAALVMLKNESARAHIRWVEEIMGGMNATGDQALLALCIATHEIASEQQENKYQLNLLIS